MSINEKAAVYIVVFSVFAVMSRMTCKWLLDIAYHVSGIPIEKIVHQKQLKFIHRAEIPFNKWLLENSKYPEKVQKYLDAYKYSIIPFLCCIGISVVGLFTHAFDGFMDSASLIVLALNMAAGVFGPIYSARFR